MIFFLFLLLHMSLLQSMGNLMTEFPVLIEITENSSLPKCDSQFGDTGDRVVVVWHHHSDPPSIRSQLFDPHGYTNGNVNILAHAISDHISLKTLQDGKYLVTWTDLVDGTIQFTIVGGGPSHFEPQVVTGIAAGNNRSSVVQLAQLSPDRFLIAWVSPLECGSEVVECRASLHFQVYILPATKQGDAVLVTSDGVQPHSSLHIAAHYEGDFLITYVGLENVIFAALFENSGFSLHSPFAISSEPHCEDLDATALPDGTYIVVWRAGNHIRGRWLNSFGYSVGPELNLDLKCGGEEGRRKPSVKPLRDGNYLVTYLSTGEDENIWIVSQAFYGPAIPMGNCFIVSNDTVEDQQVDVSFTEGNLFYTWEGRGNTVLGKVYENFFEGVSTVHHSSEVAGVNSTPGYVKSIRGPGVASREMNSTSEESSESSSGSPVSFIIGASVGAAFVLLLSLCFLFFFLLKQRRWRAATVEAQQEGAELSSERMEKGYTIIGKRWALLNKIDREKAGELHNQTGILIPFGEADVKVKVTVGQGHYGKLRLAQDIHNNTFAGVKKVKGCAEITCSHSEAVIQRKLGERSNIMPLFDAVETVGYDKKPVLYTFMPLAGFGNGEVLRKALAIVENTKVKEKLLIHVAKGILNGLSNMHSLNVFHLDIKPSNFVIDCRGYVYIIDFGCAVEVGGGKLDHSVESNGDTRYFSPERLDFLRGIVGYHPALKMKNKNKKKKKKKKFDGGKADVWAAGITLLEVASNRFPLPECRLAEKLEKWDQKYFKDALEGDPTLKDHKDNLLTSLLKELLEVRSSKRTTSSEALQHSVFQHRELQFESEEELTQTMRILSERLHTAHKEGAEAEYKKTPKEVEEFNCYGDGYKESLSLQGPTVGYADHTTFIM